MTDRAGYRAAKENALSFLKAEARFPNMVFRTSWDRYLFFESDLLFGESFIATKDALLSVGASVAIALVNLNKLSEDEESAVYFLDKGTRSAEFLSHLKRDDASEAWLYSMDRYMCASDKGCWSIYCEKENDIAVLAVQNSFPALILEKIGNVLDNGLVETKRERFDFDKLWPEWRSKLELNYAV
jgi:hypothetical protein